MCETEKLPNATREALTRMTVQLDAIRADMSSVAHLVSLLTARQPRALTEPEVTQLQAIDRVCQTLQDLSLISEALATESAATFDPKRLQLAETRAILGPSVENAASAAAGRVEIF